MRAQSAYSEASQSPPSSLKNLLVQLLKFALAIGVVIYLVSRGDLSWEPLRASLGEWEYSIPAFVILAITPLGQFWRWQNLLRAAGLWLPNREVFSFLMVSKFFNMAFPSYVSGDILRGVYIFRRSAEERGTDSSETPRATPPTVLASIIFDRAAGLLPLFVLCLVGLLGSIWYPLPARVVWWVAIVAALGVAGLSFFFLLAWFMREPPELLVRICRRLHCDGLLLSLSGVTHEYARNLRLIGRIVGISFLTQTAGIISFALFGMALKVHLPLTAYLALVPLGLLVTAIPIAPAGLGVGHVAFLSLFHIIGVSQGANLYTLYMLSYVVINLSGAFLYVSARMAAPLPQPANPTPLERD
jgi:glycosyltransferase 2 family protein